MKPIYLLFASILNLSMAKTGLDCSTNVNVCSKGECCGTATKDTSVQNNVANNNPMKICN